MSQPILYVDVSDIRPGEHERVRALMADLVLFVEANEPQLIAYGFFIDATETTMTCVAAHPDSASMLFHMDIGWEKFRAFSQYIDQRSIDVYGPAGEEVLARLRRKIEMLGKGKVSAHHLHAGFTRFDARTASGGA